MRNLKNNGIGSRLICGLLLGGIVITAVAPALAQGVDRCAQPPHRPRVCVGHVPPGSWGSAATICPPDYAFVDIDDPAGDKDAAAYPIRAVCCPLPAPDILTELHVWNATNCPPNHVATGADNSGYAKLMRCTRINTQRYKLESYVHQYFYWGSGATGDAGSIRISKKTIPAAIRSAHGRLSINRWDSDGCVAGINERSHRVVDWGGFLVTRAGKNCADHYFKRLMFAGLPGDPPANSIVPLFPACADAPQAQVPYPTCLGAPPPFPCQDNVDNDGDGLVDMNDPGCRCGEDDEQDDQVECDNGIDDDDDGDIDTDDDDCTGPEDPSESPDNVLPGHASIVPASGYSFPGQAVAFTGTFTDNDGWMDLDRVMLLVSRSVSGVGGVWLAYDRTANRFLLAEEDGFLGLPCVPGADQVLETSFVSFDCARSSVTGSGNMLNVQWVVAFNEAFAGDVYRTYVASHDDPFEEANWAEVGVWTVVRSCDHCDGGVTPPGPPGSDGGSVGTPTKPPPVDPALRGGGCWVGSEPPLITLLGLGLLALGLLGYRRHRIG